MFAEVMVENATEVRTAQHLGVHSLLLTRHVLKGGLSPDLKTLAEAQEAARIPLVVQVKPDYQDGFYENERKNKFISHLKAYRQAGISHIAVSVKEEQSVDVFFLEEILSFGFEITFQDFNGIKQPLKMLKMLGMYPRIKRVVTRGDAEHSWAGRDAIKELAYQNPTRIEVCAEFSGFSLNHLPDLIRHSGVQGIQFGAQARDDSGRLDLVFLEQAMDILMHKSLK
ncbi:copper homeostasis protein CutC [Deinococcus misasensis]|uniref:copper homeostasis protein CutC n=1 Tax=Deinococcus misasensis TaxID=392413 RepID=UPI000550AC83|nr:copper homeostasis protein CutC [Deinococcus misasensis]